MGMTIAGVGFPDAVIDAEYRIGVLEEVIDVLLQAAIPSTMTQERMDQIRKKVIQNLQDKYPEAGIRPAQSSRASPLDGLLDSPQHG